MMIKKFTVIMASLTVATALVADEFVKVAYRFESGKPVEQRIKLDEDQNGVFTLKIAKGDIPQNAKYVIVAPEFARAKVGDKGFYVSPDSMLVNFTQKPEGERQCWQQPLALSAVNVNGKAFAMITETLRFLCKTKIALKNGVYDYEYVYLTKSEKPFEDLIVKFYPLKGKDATYAGAARLYRKLKLDSGEVVPLKVRAKDNPELAYAVQSCEIRMRLGWKPYPTPVVEQTLENEPEMKVKIPFAKVCEIEKDLLKAGVDKAEICLVGWNKSGHDGRWPDSFPVEPKLGGEKGLRNLIKESQKMGFQIVCHSNAVGSCNVSPNFDKNDISIDENGKLRKGGVWSNGQNYRFCPKRYYQKFSKENIQKITELGFRGLHYIDVISTVGPVACHSKEHPITSKTSAEYWNRELADAALLMGGAASEGGYDFVAANLDFGLYITYNLNPKNYPKLTDRYVPMWHIVYNGIIMSNAATDTVNFPIKEKWAQLKVAEFATKPTFYFNSAFSDKLDMNWMGKNDLLCSNPEETKKSVAAVKQGYDLMKELGYLQYEFMQDHSQIADNVFKSVFSDGSEIITNYSQTPFEYKGELVAPMAYRLFKPSVWQRFVNLF